MTTAGPSTTDRPSPPSTSTSSSLSPSSLPSQSSHASSSRSNNNNNSNLPQPPPADRKAPSRSGQSNKFKLSRGKDKEKRHSRKHSSRGGGGDLEDDWELEGGPTPSALATSTAREENDTLGRTSVPPPPLFDSQLTEVPPDKDRDRKEKKGRGRGLAKKTSQLFSRSRDKDQGQGTMSPENGSSLNLPPSSRQNSHSSAASAESASTSTSSRNPFAMNRPGSNSSRTRSPRSSHSRRLSQDSASSWQNPPRTMRSGSSSTYDSPTDNHLPIPQRQGSQLSSSVPSLGRQSLPPPSSLADSTGTIPSRMSTWFSHLLPSTSTTTVPPPPENISASPQKKSASAAASFLNAARQRAVDGVRHLLDTEAQPDKCPDTMWVMGVPHPGWKSTTPSGSPPGVRRDISEEITTRRGSGSSELSPPQGDNGTVRPATWKKSSQPISPPNKGFGNIFSASTLSLALPASITNGSPVKDASAIAESPNKGKRAKQDKEVLTWPTQFYDDFRSVVWCTYRSQYAPIISLPPSLLIPSPDAYYSAFGPPADLATSTTSSTGSQPASQARIATSPWSWSRTEGGLTSDAGWGCMLRTGQSMLANALIHLHLGRDWRVPVSKPSTSPTTAAEMAALENYATYVRVLSWFLDDPSPLCPFSVHRMALIGKELGKEVGEWFGPSTAAGALKTLGNSFPLCGLSVATATDSMVYRSDVYNASHRPSDRWQRDGKDKEKKGSPALGVKHTTFGPRAVLILIGVRLGIDGVNPIYYESVKTLFTFPQSVGIAGGRPSSSYYFVASQANSLFYLDPHFTRPAIPLEIPPAPVSKDEAPNAHHADEEPVVVERSGLAYTLDVVDVDDISETDTASDASSPTARRKRNKATKAGKRLSAPPANANGSNRKTPATPPRPIAQPESAADPFGMPDHDPTPKSSRPMTIPVDPRTVWYANAYPEAALKTFHCEKVKKMPLSGLDPSMLLGFLVRDQADFDDFRERVKAMPHKFFSVQDEPPSWDDDDDTGLESVSEPDMDDLEGDEGDATDKELADGMAKSKIGHGGDVSGTTIQPVNIDSKEKKGPEEDDATFEMLGSTPGQAKSVESWEGVHTRRPPAAPLGMDRRGETESWIQPSKEVGAAPNGRNVL